MEESQGIVTEMWALELFDGRKIVFPGQEKGPV
jgi:hypothetical protein